MGKMHLPFGKDAFTIKIKLASSLSENSSLIILTAVSSDFSNKKPFNKESPRTYLFFIVQFAIYYDENLCKVNYKND